MHLELHYPKMPSCLLHFQDSPANGESLSVDYMQWKCVGGEDKDCNLTVCLLLISISIFHLESVQPLH